MLEESIEDVCSFGPFYATYCADKFPIGGALVEWEASDPVPGTL